MNTNPISQGADQTQIQALEDRLREMRNTSQARERIAHKQGAYDMAVHLLDSVDNCDRAIESIRVSSNDASAIYGLELLRKQMIDNFVKVGLTPFTVEGDVFDPKIHEAISLEVGVGINNTVLKVVKRGWLFNNDVVRHASVIVLRSDTPVGSVEPQAVIGSGARRRKREHVNKYVCPYQVIGCIGTCDRCVARAGTTQ